MTDEDAPLPDNKDEAMVVMMNTLTRFVESTTKHVEDLVAKVDGSAQQPCLHPHDSQHLCVCYMNKVKGGGFMGPMSVMGPVSSTPGPPPMRLEAHARHESDPSSPCHKGTACTLRGCITCQASRNDGIPNLYNQSPPSNLIGSRTKSFTQEENAKDCPKHGDFMQNLMELLECSCAGDRVTDDCQKHGTAMKLLLEKLQCTCDDGDDCECSDNPRGDRQKKLQKSLQTIRKRIGVVEKTLGVLREDVRRFGRTIEDYHSVTTPDGDINAAHLYRTIMEADKAANGRMGPNTNVSFQNMSQNSEPFRPGNLPPSPALPGSNPYDYLVTSSVVRRVGGLQEAYDNNDLRNTSPPPMLKSLDYRVEADIKPMM